MDISVAPIPAAQADSSKSRTFIGACRDFFGPKPGQPLKEFAEEVKALTQTDRAELKALFEAAGYTIIAS